MRKLYFNKREINLMVKSEVEKLLSDVEGDILVIPEEIGGMAVEAICAGSFNGVVGIKEIVFPESMICVDYMAIVNCDVEKLTFRNNLEYLDTFKLRTNKNLNCIDFEDGGLYYQTIQGNLYSADGSTLHYGLNNTVAESTIQIDTNAFYKSDIESIFIPENVTKIGYSAFQKCKRLKEVQLIGQKLFEIGCSAFAKCEKLENMKIPASVLSIGPKAFKDSGLKELIFEDRGDKYPKLEIGEKAFMNTKLDTVDFSNVKNVEVEYKAFKNAGVTNLILCGTTRIGPYAFHQCNIEAITLKSIVAYYLNPDEETLGNHTAEICKFIKEKNNKDIEVSYRLQDKVWIEG